jgi:outer membrane receptor protein involved in Fe transport
MKNLFRGRLLAKTVLAGMSLGAGVAAAPALAQTQPAAAETKDVVVITGTRITSPGYESSSPITSVGDSEINMAQPVAIEALLKDLPSAVPAIGPAVNNGANGGGTIDLRGLGSNRALVLMDGRRIVPFTLTGQVDTNVIPIALIDRVDLVTGGASAVYGADAITGVINFILKHDFEGIELNASYGISDEGDAARKRIDLTMGGNFAEGRGNAVLSLGYTLTDQLLVGDRDIGQTTTNSTTGATRGSTTTVPARVGTVTLAGGTPLLAAAPNTPTCPNSLGATVACDGMRINPTTGALVPAGDNDTRNTNPNNLFQAPLDRYQVTGLANYQVNDWIEAYADMLYVRSNVHTQLDTSGTFANTFDVPIGNPFIPQAARNQICAARNIAAANCVVGNTTIVPLTIDRRITEFGPRLNDFNTKTLQYTVGIRGDIPMWENWNYDIYYNHGESDQVQTRGHWGSLSKVRQALNAVSTTACVTTSNNCVPLNLFGAEGSITPAMINFIDLSALLQTHVDQEIISASVSGDLGAFKSPWAANPIGVAGGYEYRRMNAGTQSDGSSQIQGEVLGTGAPTPDRKGAYQLHEWFAEASVPLISDMMLVDDLSLELGYRYTEFASAAEDNYDTYKVGLNWAPIDDLRFRGMFQHAVRAPSVNELFAPQVTGLSNLSVDPCQGTSINQAQATTAGSLSNLCRLTGVPTGVIGALPAPSSGQVNVLSGGNPNLGPEVADTTTIGFVYQPSWLPRFRVAVDYWNIEIEDAITGPSVTDILQSCYTTALNPSLAFNGACALVGRNPSTGTLNGVESRGVVTAIDNLGKLKSQGWDFAASYQLPLGNLGDLALKFQGTLLNDQETQPTPTSVNRECTGYYSVACGNNFSALSQNLAYYDYKWTLGATWSYEAFDVSLNWRHLSELDDEPGAPTFLPQFSHIDAFDYFDLAGVWDFNDHLRFNVTINNLFDEEPPFVGNTIGTTGTNSGNTFPTYYDAIGRYMTFGAKVRY